MKVFRMQLFRLTSFNHRYCRWKQNRYAAIHTAFIDAVKYRSKPESSLLNPSEQMNEGMHRLTGCFQRGDCTNFDRALSSYAKTSWKLSSDERKQLSSMISILLDKFSQDQIAYILRNLASCGYSMKKSPIEDRTLLSAMKTQFLKTNSSVYGKILFLSALNKLQFTLKESEDKEGILLLIEKISGEKITGKQLAEFINAVLGIGIQWNSLTLLSQERLIKQILQIEEGTVDTKTTFSLLYGLLSFNEKKFQHSSSQMNTVFLRLLRNCLLQSKENEDSRNKEKLAMHVSCCCLFVVPWVLTLLRYPYCR
jgi:hypothetical protein